MRLAVTALALLTVTAPLAALVSPAAAVQQTIVWGGGNGEWDDPGTTGQFWDPDNEFGPDNNDDAVCPTAGTTYIVKIDNGASTSSAVTLDTNIAIDQLHVSAPDAFTLLSHSLQIGVTDGCGNFTGGGVVVNDGSIVVQGGALAVGGLPGSPGAPGTITNNGTITVGGPTGPVFRMAGDVTLDGTGTLSLVTALPGDTDLGSLHGMGSGFPGPDKLVHSSGHTIQGVGFLGGIAAGTDLHLANAGLIDANVDEAAGQRLVVRLSTNPAGTNENTGVIRASNGGVLEFNSTELNNAGGTIAALDASRVEISSNGTEITGGDLTTEGTGVIRFVSHSNTLSGVTITDGSLVEVEAATVKLVGTITNDGLLDMPTAGPATLRVDDGPVTLAGAGTLRLGGTGNSVASSGACCQLTNGASHTIRGGGSLGVVGSGQLLPLANFGTIIADAASALVIKTTDGGFTNESTGVIEIAAGSTLDVNESFTNGGTIRGGGLLELPGTQTLTNAGEVSPGASAGTLTVGSHYTQTAAGVLRIELGGAAAGEFDVLAVTGTATLDGTIAATLIDGFVPDPGQTFVVMTFASRVGQFATEQLDLGQGRYATIQYGPTSVTLTIQPLDHYLCYKAKVTPGTGFQPPSPVNLVDQFGAGTAEVQKPESLCTPVEKNGEARVDQDTHLVGYQLKPQKAQHVGLEIRNQFHPAPNGTLFVDTVKADRLLVPAAKSHVSPPPAPNPAGHEVDHYKCYTVKRADGSTFTPVQDVDLVDQFIEAQLPVAKRFDLKKPTRLCAPVDKNGSGIKHPVNHLVCYQAKPVAGQPRHARQPGLYLADQFGAVRLDTVQDEELCVPSSKILPVP